MSLGQVSRVLRSKRALVPLLLILVSTSAAFSLSTSVLLSVYSVQGVASDHGVIVVSQRGASTGFSGELPLSLLGALSSIHGVEVVSPEVFAPSMMLGRPVMVRGVDPPSFLKIQQLHVLDGWANFTSGGAIAGVDLASRDHIRAGSTVFVSGDLAGATTGIVELTITGIFKSGTLLDSELIAPLWVGQWLRGLDYGTVSLFRVKVDPSMTQTAQSISAILASSGEQQPKTSLLPGSLLSFLPSSPSSASASIAGVLVQPSSSTEQFLTGEFGASEDSVWLLCALVFVSMSVALFFCFQDSFEAARKELTTLRQLGMNLRAIAAKLLAINLLLALLAGLGGWMVCILILGAYPPLQSFQVAFYVVRLLSESSQTFILIATLAVSLAEAAIATSLLVLRLDAGRRGVMRREPTWQQESGGVW